ncbi:MAG: hypothetical protein U1E46_11665 [Hyphomicrobiales bacterium]
MAAKRIAMIAAMVGALAGAPGVVLAQSNEDLKVVSDLVRDTGTKCSNPSSAVRDPSESKPDEPVYILTCDEGVYEVRVVPDMAPKITKRDKQPDQ